MDKALISVLITEHGKGVSFISELKKIGIESGFALRGEGTVNSEILELLDLNYSTKDLVFCAVDIEEEEKFYEILKSKDTFIGAHSGIAFSVPLDKYAIGERESFPLSIVILIIDAHKNKKTLDIAKEYGVRGGTIISGRGAGVPKEYYFPITVEPEKSIFLFIMPSRDSKKFREVFVEKLNLIDPGQGMMFTLPLSNSYGIRGMDE